MLPHHVIADVS